jgi:hypothetical protein
MGPIAILVAAALMLGQQATPALTEAPAPVESVCSAACDAYESFDALGLEPVESSATLMLDYVRTEHGSRPKVATVYGYFVLESQSSPGDFHVMRWVEIHTA